MQYGWQARVVEILAALIVSRSGGSRSNNSKRSNSNFRSSSVNNNIRNNTHHRIRDGNNDNCRTNQNRLCNIGKYETDVGGNIDNHMIGRNKMGDNFKNTGICRNIEINIRRRGGINNNK